MLHFTIFITHLVCVIMHIWEIIYVWIVFHLEEMKNHCILLNKSNAYLG